MPSKSLASIEDYIISMFSFLLPMVNHGLVDTKFMKDIYYENGNTCIQWVLVYDEMLNKCVNFWL